MEIKKLLMLIGFVLGLSITVSIFIGCDPMYFKEDRHSSVILKNNSEISIYVYVHEIENVSDTTINVLYPTLYKFRVVEFGKSDHVAYTGLGEWWEKVFRYKNLQYISIYIFEKSFLEPHIGDENFTVTDTMALQRYDLTLENFNTLNWSISYPPDERMKDMKMYPPYKPDN